MKFYQAKIYLGTISENLLEKNGYENSIKGARKYFLDQYKRMVELDYVKDFIPCVESEDIEPIDAELESGEIIPTWQPFQKKREHDEEKNL